MRLPAFALVSLLLMGATGARAASDCSISVTPSPDGTAYSLIFDGIDGFFAEVDPLGDPVPAHCAISSPIDQLPPGTFAVYSADYRGFENDGTTGRMAVLNNGRVVGVIVPPEGEVLVGGVFFTGYVGSNGNGDAIVSTIDLSLIDFDDPGSLFKLDSIDYLELARATGDELQASADQLASARTALVTHLNATFDLLEGAGQPLTGPDRLAFIGAVGSVTAGIGGRRSIGNGLSVQGGAAFVDQAAGGAAVRGALFSGSLRYLGSDDGQWRPFIEGGLRLGPALGMRFTRSYQTTLGAATATGSTGGLFLGGYVTGGVLVAPTPEDEIVFAATLEQSLLHTDAYDEVLDGSNLFAASAPAQTGSFTTARADADWTSRLTQTVSLTLSGGLGYTLAHGTVQTAIGGAGTFSSAGVSEGFVAYGARAAYEVNDTTSIGAFVRGVTGAVSGTHVQFGGDAHVSF